MTETPTQIQNQNPANEAGVKEIKVLFLKKDTIMLYDGSRYTATVEFYDVNLQKNTTVNELISLIMDKKAVKVRIYEYSRGLHKLLVEVGSEYIEVYSGTAPSGADVYMTMMLPNSDTPIYLIFDLADLLQGKMNIKEYMAKVLDAWMATANSITSDIKNRSDED